MSKGIYCYIDNENDEVVYVGKDSNIDKDIRHKDHFQLSRYDEQVINRVLQNNQDRYIYQRLWKVDNCTDNHLNEIEKYYIKKYNPQFNFTEGGDGTSGYKWTDEQKEKISGKKRPEETKRKISENHADVSGKNNPRAKYNLWDILYVYYHKRNMFKNNRTPNPCACFRYKYKGYILPIGLFHDFITPQIINDLISDALDK